MCNLFIYELASDLFMSIHYEMNTSAPFIWTEIFIDSLSSNNLLAWWIQLLLLLLFELESKIAGCRATIVRPSSNIFDDKFDFHKKKGAFCKKNFILHFQLLTRSQLHILSYILEISRHSMTFNYEKKLTQGTYES